MHANQACQAAAAVLNVLVIIVMSCLITYLERVQTVQHQHGDGQTWPSISFALTNHALLQLQNILHSFNIHEM